MPLNILPHRRTRTPRHHHLSLTQAYFATPLVYDVAAEPQRHSHLWLIRYRKVCFRSSRGKDAYEARLTRRALPYVGLRVRTLLRCRLHPPCYCQCQRVPCTTRVYVRLSPGAFGCFHDIAIGSAWHAGRHSPVGSPTREMPDVAGVADNGNVNCNSTWRALTQEAAVVCAVPLCVRGRCAFGTCIR